MSQMACICRGLAQIEDLERLLVDWEREIFSTVIRFKIIKNSRESFMQFTLSCDSCICEVSYCIVS